MSKSKSIGIVVVLALILGIVSLSVLKNASSAPGIALRDPEPHLPKAGTRFTNPGRASSGAMPSTGPSDRPNSDGPDVIRSRSGGADASPTEGAATRAEVVVQVAGAVKKPGVYHLSGEARNDDAVKAAGGLSAGANAASVNLAARAVDGSQLYIKTLKEQPAGGVDTGPSTAVAVGSAAQLAAPLRNHRSAAAANRRGTGSRPAKLKDPSEGKINLNTASADELQRITGIGPSMAEKIIAYRQENHGFQSIEDVMQVSGVGAKKFARWEPFLKIR